MKPISAYKSFWEFTKDRSNYHFDKWREETPGELYRVLGRFPNTWQDELAEIKARSFVTTQKNITYTAGRNQPGVANPQRQYDYDQFGGHGDIYKIEMTNVMDDFTDFPELQKLVDYFGMTEVAPKCHIQYTGQMFTVHIDPLKKQFAGTKTGDYDDDFGYDPNDIVRITVMLEDWEPGQFYAYGNSVYKQWRAGDFHIHDWPNVPHATANASMHSRTTLQITGIRTEATDKIIGKTRFPA